MKNKLLYTPDEVQAILKKAIEATSRGVMDFINNEKVIVDQFFNIEVSGAILVNKTTSKKK
ncbi:hypothetical protein PFY10_19950 [Chryseobacterium daecheongense]|nr:hypothetical protein PFY10_19950 [Chryseobacterium daecheongense]